MRKSEFLEKLRLALNGRIPYEQVEDNLNYYEDYINTQIRLGHSEEQVMQELGDPRLIAKTIIGTSKLNQESADTYEEVEAEYEQNNVGKKKFRLPLWVWGIIGILILFVVLGLIFSVINFLLPVLIPLALILIGIKLLRNSR